VNLTLHYRFFFTWKIMNQGAIYGDRSAPSDIDDEFALTAASQLRRQTILLYSGLGLSIPGVMAIADPSSSAFVGLLVPLVILGCALAGLYVLLRYRPDRMDPLAARRFLGRITRLSIAIVVLGSLWCLESWFATPPEIRIYYPLMMALGGYATGYCLAPLRKAAIACVVILFLPNALLLISSGHKMDVIAGCTMLLAAAFQLMLIANHSKMLKEMLSHRSQARQLARVDSLTRLINRGALLDEITEHGSKAGKKRLLVIDIDNFKTINDTYGHDMGDQVLRQIGQILSRYATADICASRLGGEEFALFGPVNQIPEGIALKILSEIRNTAMAHKEQVTVSIGIAEGEVICEKSWRALYARADAELYAAKNAGRNQISSGAALAGSNRTQTSTKGEIAA
jgi:diguanylate cyclase (GGDEF)-like protein